MTTSPVMSVTDEMVAELDALAGEACQYSPEDWFSADSLWSAMEKDDAAYVEKASPWLIRALLAERAELLRDAGRYRWICNGNGYFMEENMLCHVSNDKAEADAAIDAAIATARGAP